MANWNWTLLQAVIRQSIIGMVALIQINNHHQRKVKHRFDHSGQCSVKLQKWNGTQLKWKGDFFSSSHPILTLPLFSLYFFFSLSVETCGQLLCFHVVRWSKLGSSSNCPPLKPCPGWDQDPSRWGGQPWERRERVEERKRPCLAEIKTS